MNNPTFEGMDQQTKRAAAEKVVNEVWESCSKDTRPFDEVSRGFSSLELELTPTRYTKCTSVRSRATIELSHIFLRAIANGNRVYWLPESYRTSEVVDIVSYTSHTSLTSPASPSVAIGIKPAKPLTPYSSTRLDGFADLERPTSRG
jgi:hypothetical protein